MAGPTVHHVRVAPEHSGVRLDKWLATLDLIPSRSRAAELIEQGFITCAGKVLKGSFKVTAGLEITIQMPAPEPSGLVPLNRPLEILFEDRDVVVVNKPSGLVVHPSAGHAQDTLVNILLHHVHELSMGFGEHRPGIVHRIDRDASGILVVAKNDPAHQSLAQQFRLKTAHRLYWAIVHGRPTPASGTLRTHLARHPSDRKRFASHPTGAGKLAVTHYATKQGLPSKLSWLECRLETGRTHQIRVHLAEKGWPIVGDPIYGLRRRHPADQKATRLLLHACELGFQHPRTGEQLSFKVDWPAEAKRSIHDLGFMNV